MPKKAVQTETIVSFTLTEAQQIKSAVFDALGEINTLLVSSPTSSMYLKVTRLNHAMALLTSVCELPAPAIAAKRKSKNKKSPKKTHDVPRNHYSRKEIAKKLGLSTSRVYVLLKTMKAKSVRIGKSNYYVIPKSMKVKI